MTQNDMSARALWLAAVMLLGAIGALSAVALLLAAGSALPDALIGGGGAFVSLVLLGLSVHRFLMG